MYLVQSHELTVYIVFHANITEHNLLYFGTSLLSTSQGKSVKGLGYQNHRRTSQNHTKNSPTSPSAPNIMQPLWYKLL